MNDNRRSQRSRTLKSGSILFDLSSSIDCTVRNISNAGALLAVESPVGIPDDFTLLIRPELKKRACHVIWRSADKIGVRFI